ncbi:MAG TPA: hypothetical protein VJG30_00365 [Candidatus Nanoarchaeia archaeon]|nr:hypothetical protein [Candidatus Nanoarchaeia archaeon]
MFNKKEIAELRSEISKLNQVVDEANKNIGALKSSSEDSKKIILEKINDITTRQVSYFEEFDKSLTAFNDMNLRYRKEFDSLGNFKNQLTDKILERIDREVKDELQKHFAKLELEKKNFETLSKELENLKNEIQKLKTISETIKAIDFELVNYTKKLAQEDHEKLRLMMQVDNLQKLIGKIRQGKHQ